MHIDTTLFGCSLKHLCFIFLHVHTKARHIPTKKRKHRTSAIATSIIPKKIKFGTLSTRKTLVISAPRKQRQSKVQVCRTKIHASRNHRKAHPQMHLFCLDADKRAGTHRLTMSPCDFVILLSENLHWSYLRSKMWSHNRKRLSISWRNCCMLNELRRQQYLFPQAFVAD